MKPTPAHKKRLYVLSAIALSTVSSLFVALSCTNSTRAKAEDEAALITVNLGDGSKASITDYQVKAKVFTANSRIANSHKLSKTYTLSTKIINNSLYSRIDFDSDESGGLSRKSVISGPNGSVVFDTDTSAVLYRVPARTTGAETLDMSGRTLIEKVNIHVVQGKMRSLGFDIAYEEGIACDEVLCITTPQSLLPKTSEGKSVSSYKIMFDTANGMLAGSELIEAQDDGTILTTTVTKYYQEADGVTVPAGELLSIHHNIPGQIEYDDAELPGITSIEDLPEMSVAEYKAQLLAGQASEVPEAIIGNPGDPDFTETILTVYESISTNCLSDSVFKIAGVE